MKGKGLPMIISNSLLLNLIRGAFAIAKKSVPLACLKNA